MVIRTKDTRSGSQWRGGSCPNFATLLSTVPIEITKTIKINFFEDHLSINDLHVRKPVFFRTVLGGFLFLEGGGSLTFDTLKKDKVVPVDYCG